MPHGKNKWANKGTDYERSFVNQAKEDGKLAFRSAGSHSPIDVCIIDRDHATINFIQCKINLDTMSEKEISDIRATMPKNGVYSVFFSVQ